MANFLEIKFFKFIIWFLKLKLLSIMTPKNFIHGVAVIEPVPNTRDLISIEFRYENIINLLLSIFILILFDTIQLFTFIKFEFIKARVSSGDILLVLQRRLLSSAKSVNLKKLLQFGKSLINRRNKRGFIFNKTSHLG